MDLTVNAPDGWTTLRRDGLELLLHGSSTEGVEAALAARGESDPADVVLDELMTDGFRQAPDFALICRCEQANRVIVRGRAVAWVTRDDGPSEELAAGPRAPWRDEDLPDDVSVVELNVLGDDGAVLPAAHAHDVVDGQDAREEEQAPLAESLTTSSPQESTSDDGWAAPSVFGGTALTAGASEASIDSGPVAEAGGYHEPTPQGEATLAPPSEDDLDAYFDRSSQSVGDGQQPDDILAVASSESAPMTGADEPWQPASFTESAPASDDGEPAGADDFASIGAPVAAQEGESDGTASPEARFPHFEDGHLVGHRLAPAPGAAASPRFDEATQAELPAYSEPEPTPQESAPEYGAGAALPESAPPAAARPQVLAVRCPNGHLNAPHAPRCRVCHVDLPFQEPELVDRPALGVLRLPDGTALALDRGALIGRAPKAAADLAPEETPHLVRVPSPDNEISRNHAEIIIDGWHVMVRDLGSINGTVVALPGSSPMRLRQFDQQGLEPGSTITLADQYTITFEPDGS